jgi:hypothetical protein
MINYIYDKSNIANIKPNTKIKARGSNVHYINNFLWPTLTSTHIIHFISNEFTKDIVFCSYSHENQFSYIDKLTSFIYKPYTKSYLYKNTASKIKEYS